MSDYYLELVADGNYNGHACSLDDEIDDCKGLRGGTLYTV